MCLTRSLNLTTALSKLIYPEEIFTFMFVPVNCVYCSASSVVISQKQDDHLNAPLGSPLLALSDISLCKIDFGSGMSRGYARLDPPMSVGVIGRCPLKGFPPNSPPAGMVALNRSSSSNCRRNGAFVPLICPRGSPVILVSFISFTCLLLMILKLSDGSCQPSRGLTNHDDESSQKFTGKCSLPNFAQNK